ncbi:RusA family crossover junction endodeoxyribonuclease [Peptoniphilus sp. MSJ-1]|uniref:RusA family crossover junction endodeoxyribonuclease n=1 Tax=Peptoniphilus ovalis TaxID=2841503 RepID=A0ABS6FHB0_9FIRM|nr:RusA family crossover junction endodeoxyribonuclease [Peptoniphilus ovalis]MBU5669562.1 RusA family crossover junction endodeoxyribonuclease [Peptoniphilus ovalis]
MKYTLTYEIQLPTMNQVIKSNRGNKYAAASQKKKYTKLIAYYTLAQMKKEITKKVDIKCNWYCKDKRTDKDNVSTGIKFILDGLQEAGILKNDGWNEIGYIHHYFYLDKDNPRIVLELQEIQEEI